jgi:hypothetical protein
MMAILRMIDLPIGERNLRRTRTDYVVIYALVDPRSGEIRYIGKTEKRIAQRLAEHVQWPVNASMRSWIAEVQTVGALPRIEPITCCGAQWWEGKEAYWIRWARLRGGRLLNRDPGGVCRKPCGKLNTTGRVKNYIAKKFGRRPSVRDWWKEKTSRDKKRRKYQNGVPRAPTGLDPIRMTTQRERCQDKSIHPTVRRNGRIVSVTT